MENMQAELGILDLKETTFYATEGGFVGVKHKGEDFPHVILRRVMPLQQPPHIQHSRPSITYACPCGQVGRLPHPGSPGMNTLFSCSEHPAMCSEQFCMLRSRSPRCSAVRLDDSR